MLNENQIKQYSENGFLKIGKYFDEFEMNKIINEIEKVKDNKAGKFIFEKDGKTVRSIMSFHHKSILFQNIFSSKLNVLAEQILNETVYIYQSKINIKSSNEKGKKWDYHRGMSFWNILDGVKTMNLLSIFIYVTKQTPENGCVFALEKSHLEVDIAKLHSETNIISKNSSSHTSDTLGLQIKDDLIPIYNRKYKKIYLTGEAGDIVLMHPSVIHASESNKSNKKRILIIPVYNALNNLPGFTSRPSYLCERIQ